jgi:hypothetical protein
MFTQLNSHATKSNKCLNSHIQHLPVFRLKGKTINKALTFPKTTAAVSYVFNCSSLQANRTTKLLASVLNAFEICVYDSSKKSQPLNSALILSIGHHSHRPISTLGHRQRGARWRTCKTLGF